MRHALVLLCFAGSAAAQPPQEVTLVRPMGVYEGVEPGGAQPPPALARVAAREQRTHASILTWPGFQPLPNGGSRFFVQTTHPIATAIRVEQGRVVVLFPRTAIHLRNSARWLETRFFSTPVTRARLERRHSDMALVLYLRAQVVPSVSTEVAPGGNFHYVYIDFPPGDYGVPVTPPPVATPGLVVHGPDSLVAEPPPAPARPLDPTLRALDNEPPPPVE